MPCGVYVADAPLYSFIFYLYSLFPCSCQGKSVPLHSKSECGEIWLLATTIKNAKIEGQFRTTPR